MAFTKHSRNLHVVAFAFLLLPTHGFAQVEVEAVSGQPFGVGRLTVPITGDLADPSEVESYRLVDAEQRALYPAVEYRAVRESIRQLLGIRRQPRREPTATVYFLFQGEQPLDLTFYTFAPQQVRAVPRSDPRARSRLLEAWWRQYARTASRVGRSAEYPPLVENFLAASLSRRLGLRLPPLTGLLDSFSAGDDGIGRLVGSESLARSLERDRVLGDPRFSAAADMPLPVPPAQRELLFPDLPAEVEVESIAEHVPADAFYVRFGNFTNYLWLRNFMKRWEGDIRNMVALRGIDYKIDKRIEQQLALTQSELAQILGPTVISDVALVGDDLFLREGAGLGMLFEARNHFLLARDISGQRQEALKTHADATEQTLDIGGHQVSFISTPDNRVRSFYAVDGIYHFITTSRSLAQRFLEAGTEKRSLAASDEFRYARSRMPASNDYTVFAYFSDRFLQKLATPRYQIEMQRRLIAAGDINAMVLARLAARAEGREAWSVEELIAAGQLPQSFASRSDGGHAIETDAGWIDSLRGKRGCFLPAADVELGDVSLAEYRELEGFYSNQFPRWQAMGPVVAALTRTELGDGYERLAIDVSMTPCNPRQITPKADWLGSPTNLAVDRVPGDIASIDLVLDKTLELASKPTSDYHLLAGLRDYRSRWAVEGGRIVADEGRPVELVRGYLGAWPFSGLLPLLLDRPDPPPIAFAPGLRPPSTGLFSAKVDSFTVFSLKPGVLGEVTPHLRMADAPRPAQARVHIGDPTGLEFAETIDAYGYQRARQTSLSVARLMNSIASQLHAAPDECDMIARELLDAEFACALQGEYILAELPGGLQAWTTSALAAENRLELKRIPPDFRLSLLRWFRGLDAELLMLDDEVSLRAELQMKLDD